MKHVRRAHRPLSENQRTVKKAGPECGRDDELDSGLLFRLLGPMRVRGSIREAVMAKLDADQPKK